MRLHAAQPYYAQVTRQLDDESDALPRGPAAASCRDRNPTRAYLRETTRHLSDEPHRPKYSTGGIAPIRTGGQPAPSAPFAAGFNLDWL